MHAENLLLAALPHEVYEHLEKNLEQVSLPPSKILHHPGDTIEHVYFPINCLISVTITMKDGSTVEAGVIGNREMVGINAFMGGTETTQTEYIVQVAGDAITMKAEPLRKEFDQNKQMRDVMLKYTQAFIGLEHISCECYQTLQDEYKRLLKFNLRENR